MKYRVREALVEVCNGYRCWHERKFIAERRITLFGALGWWWPVLDGDWRWSAEIARRDAIRDAHLRAPLGAPEIVEVR